MEFVSESEVNEVLSSQGIEHDPRGDEKIFLKMNAGDEHVRLHLSTAESPVEPADGATVISVEMERLPQVIEHIIHLLHMDQILLVPVGKWRKVFDAVAFSLAENEDWQEIDAAATVELNTRDPLLCEPQDFHTLIALIGALMNDADSEGQGMLMISPAAPILIEVNPAGAIRIDLGNQVLADELEDAFVR
ncbi:MAG: hypothetical protein EA377_04460 [Phycisphaerales bacterium]|nr:MAG: hypothetical protein EA377_04460 [Phycisphaerales bacterium]